MGVACYLRSGSKADIERASQHVRYVPIADIGGLTYLNWLVVDQTDQLRVNQGMRRALLFVLILTLTLVPAEARRHGHRHHGGLWGFLYLPHAHRHGIATIAKLPGATTAPPCAQRPHPTDRRDASTPRQTWFHQIGNYSHPIQT